MSRVISTDGPGTVRNQLRRTIAEALHHLGQKRQVDDEVKDLAALIVFCLHGIADTVDQTMAAWEKRDYYVKAERFRQEWAWVEPATEELSELIYRGQWERLPAVMGRLAPHLSDVRVKQMTRNPSLWKGAYQRFLHGFPHGLHG